MLSKLMKNMAFFLAPAKLSGAYYDVTHIAGGDMTPYKKKSTINKGFIWKKD